MRAHALTVVVLGINSNQDSGFDRSGVVCLPAVRLRSLLFDIVDFKVRSI